MKKKIINSMHLLYLISCLTPKSKNIWIFGAWFGRKFTDNPKRVFIYAHTQENLTCVWITRSLRLAREMRENGYNAHHYMTPKGLYYQMRAGAAFFTHDTSIDMLGPAISGKTVRIQLWHGTPLKKIRYGNEKHSGRADIMRRERIFRFFPWLNDTDYDLVPAASDTSIKDLQQAFQTQNVHVTGYPRNDVLKVGHIIDTRRKIKRCIYMPTFRGGFRTEESSLLMQKYLEDSGFDVEKIDLELDRLDIDLVLRLHPTNIPNASIVEKISKSRHIKLDNSEEIYEQLNDYDVLITDYSSIFFDFLITGRPIIHAAFDLEEYQRNSRDLYFAFSDICLTPEIDSWQDILTKLNEFNEHGIPENYASRYDFLAEKFNTFRDNQSSKRVFEWVQDALANSHTQPTKTQSSTIHEN